MRHFPTLLAHEVKTLLVSPGTYIAAVLFLFVMGFVFMRVLESYVGLPQETSPALVFFQLFWVPVLFMVPLLTMKSISEERRAGTLETLLTSPVSTFEVVLSKFGAAYVFYLLLWAATGGFNALLYHFSRDPRFFDFGALAGGYLFVAASGLLFIAVGILCSAVSRSQAVAGILSFVLLLLLLVGIPYLPSLLRGSGESLLTKARLLEPVRAAADNLQSFQHVEDFTRGVVDTRQLLFYFTGCALLLLLSVVTIEVKQLRS